MRVDTVRDVN